MLSFINIYSSKGSKTLIKSLVFPLKHNYYESKENFEGVFVILHITKFNKM